MLTDQMLPATICQPGEGGWWWCLATGLGLKQLFQLLFTLEFRACVSHYLSFKEFSFLYQKDL